MQIGLDFLDHFLLDREESTSEYESPQYSNQPRKVFETVEKLMCQLELETTNWL